MRQYFVTLLMLATVALSSSNILPISVNHFSRDLYDLESQSNDNTFSNRYQPINTLDELFKIYIGQKEQPVLSKLLLKHGDNNRDDILRLINKDFNYNGEGFRKEQWHNYPRQLDRLHQFHERNTVKKSNEPDPNNGQYTDEVAPDMEDTSNEFHLEQNPGTNHNYEADEPTTNPLLIFKISLACLKKDINEANIQPANREENPAMNVIKVKRGDSSSSQEIDMLENTTDTKEVNKRIFSLWSRLQSLNHKGHELQHRRHLHAFYGLPDSDGGGGGTLTAETRAALMRPPGSPLRWG